MGRAATVSAICINTCTRIVSAICINMCMAESYQNITLQIAETMRAGRGATRPYPADRDRGNEVIGCEIHWSHTLILKSYEDSKRSWVAFFFSPPDRLGCVLATSHKNKQNSFIAQITLDYSIKQT